MKKIIILLAILLFATMQGAFAQRTITGKVINAEDKLGMAGVYVVVKGTTTATTTDDNGNFMLNVPNDATIVVSFIGFKTVELPVGTQTQFDIALQTDINVLGGVVVRENRVIPPERAVVTAMGIVRDKIALTFSIQSMLGSELVRASSGLPPDDIMTALNGRIAGVEAYRGGDIQIRGQKSFNFPSLALYVIDGVPIGTNMPPINSEDIKSVTILKSANAAMLYGSQGANGVVLIELKK